MKRRLIAFVHIFVMLTWCGTLAAQEASLQSVFETSNNAFWNGNYQGAIDGYEKLDELGVEDVAMHYNLATAYARLGRLGLAILHYEKALVLDPGHGDTHYNLSMIREYLARRASEQGRNADLAPAVSAWRAMLDHFSERSAANSFLIFWVLFFLLLLTRRFVRAEMPRLTLGVLAGVLGLLWVATGTVTVGKWYQQENVVEAVVISEGLMDVYEGPGSEVKRFAIEEGSRVLVLEEREGWIRLRDSEQRDGWATADLLGTI